MLKYAVILCLFLSGCATAPPVGKPSVSTASLAGTYHTVVKGETLWRISRNYGIDLEELTRVNRIADNRSIEVGQRIFIPDKMKGSYKITKYSEGDDFIWPLQGRVVSSFGQTDNYMVNKGIKISPYNSQDVLASRSGKVIFVGKDVAGLNRVVIIDHADGLFTVYGLCCNIFVKPGDNIRRGELIGKIRGSSKDDSLHFEIRKGHLSQNPVFYLP